MKPRMTNGLKNNPPKNFLQPTEEWLINEINFKNNKPCEIKIIHKTEREYGRFDKKSYIFRRTPK